MGCLIVLVHYRLSSRKRERIVMRMFHFSRAVPLATLLCAVAVNFHQTPLAVAKPVNGAPGLTAVATPPAPEKNPIRRLAELRSKLDSRDHAVAMRALHLALSRVPDGGTFIWQKKGHALKGVIKPTKAFRDAQGRVCRHVIYALALGRYTRQIEGIACRSEDGSWQL